MKKFYFLLASFFIILFLQTPALADDTGYLVKVAPKSATLFSHSAAMSASPADSWLIAEDDAGLAAIQKEYEVLHVEPNYPVTLFFLPSDEYYSYKWDLDMIGATSAWDIGCFGNEVRIGVIDSGVYPHEDIKNNILSGYNYLDKNDNTADNIGHGTAVSGVIAAETNGTGTVGMAHRAKIVPLKCFDTGKTTKIDTVIAAIYGAVDDFDCDIINMSLGIEADSTAFSDAISYANQKGVIVIAAVGNSGNSTLYYPAAYDSVVGVGAVDSEGTATYFTQHNSSVCVTAPGLSVLTLSTDGGYYYESGTSVSSPHVSALAAIAKNIKPDITPAEFKELLAQTATDAGDEGYDTSYGYGIVNVTAFIEKILADTDIFLSPITTSQGSEYVYITNYTDTDFTGKLFFAFNASDDTLGSVNLLSISQQGGTTVCYIVPSVSYHHLNALLWKNNLNGVYVRKTPLD